MKNIDKLPKCIMKILETSQVSLTDVLSFAYVDMNISFEFVKSYVILTKDYFIFVEGKLNKNNVFDFVDKTVTAVNESPSEYLVEKIPLNEIASLKTNIQLRTGMLYLEGKITRLITYFTIGRYSDVLQLVMDFDTLKNKKAAGENANNKSEKSDMYLMKDAPVKKTKLAVSLRLFEYLKPHWFKMIIVLLFYLAIAGCNLVWPYLSGTVLYDGVLSKNPEIIDRLNVGNNDFVYALGLVVICMLAAKLLILVLNCINNLINAFISNKIVMEMRNDVFESMGQLSLRYFQSAQTGTLMVRVLQDAYRVSKLLIDEVPSIIINLFTIGSTVVVMLILNIRLTLVSLIMFPIIFYISTKMRPRLHVLFGKRHRAVRQMTTAINDNITGVRVVKVFGKWEDEEKNFKSVNEGVKNIEREMARFSIKLEALYSVAAQLTSMIIWSVGAYLIFKDSDMTYGILLTFTAYLAQLNVPFNNMIRAFKQWIDSVNAAERLFEIIDAKPEITDKENAIELKASRGEIEIKNVTFGYEPNMPVLKDFSFKVEAGKTLGIVGRSGAGKTTLVNIISRMYEVEKGSICIDGIDIRDISLESLRKNIAMVSQETYIFMGSIAENIAYAKPDATREEIINAAIKANAHEFICKLPEGYDTIIGASGRALSGGERQRVSIARAILANPKILILDEATASVDTKTEQAIQASLTELSKNRTTISIAHRLSTLKDADYLIVIDHGQIIEEGTHDELIEKNGLYCKLKELQTNALALKGLE